MNAREWARDLVVAAGAHAVEVRRRGVTRHRKSHQDFVTAADREIEEMVRQAVEREFPGDRFFGEETAGDRLSLHREEAAWVLDPVDGTTNYAAGLDAWCVSLARVTASGIDVAAIAAPDRREVYCASRGGGAMCNGVPLDLSAQPVVPHNEALIMTGKGARLPVEEYLAVVRRLLDRGYEYRRYGSGALGIAMVSTGVVQGYIETGMHVWDIAAAHLIVAEARGYCSPFPLNPLAATPGPPLVVCHQGLQDGLMAVLTGEQSGTGQ